MLHTHTHKNKRKETSRIRKTALTGIAVLQNKKLNLKSNETNTSEE